MQFTLNGNLLVVHTPITLSRLIQNTTQKFTIMKAITKLFTLMVNIRVASLTQVTREWKAANVTQKEML